MRPIPIALALAVAALLAPALAGAGPSVSLNGVAIDGVTGQRFEGCTVVIDERGNIDILAKGYAVRTGSGGPGPESAAGTSVASSVRPPPTAPPPVRKLTRRYFLAAEQTAPGAGYDLAIFINAQWIREVKAGEPQVVMEITRHLQPGQNRLVLAATKRRDGERPSTSAALSLKVIVGEGNVGGGHVMIESPLVEMTRTAAEGDDRTEEYAIEAR